MKTSRLKIRNALVNYKSLKIKAIHLDLCNIEFGNIFNFVYIFKLF
jgi:hypothetical protein